PMLSDRDVVIGSTGNRNTPDGEGTPTNTNRTAGAEAAPSCEDAGGIAWLLCGIINATDMALNWVDEQIEVMLTVDRNAYDNPSIQQAWGNIRNIAYLILIPIMLVMVIGTALGYEAISAYTVKRALPRLLIATVFI